MSLPVYTASEQRKRVITSAPRACCLRVTAGNLVASRSALIEQHVQKKKQLEVVNE